MTWAVAAVNLVLGAAYCGYGVMTALEMRRDRRSFGFSHFGAAWIAMAFTCGPHHLIHGVHVALEGRPGGPLDLVAVVVGLPAGVVWLSLRVEAFLDGPGDRFIPGTPGWVRLLPAGAAAYVAGLVAAAVVVAGGAHAVTWLTLANLLLVVIYLEIGRIVLRTQLANRPGMRGWSLSGLCLAVIFPTCALMHAVWIAYASAGVYHDDVHGLVNDWLSVPAGLYFLWVVRRLYRDSLHDWNEGPAAAKVVPTTLG